jgi:hypothetical protein
MDQHVGKDAIIGKIVKRSGDPSIRQAPGEHRREAMSG